MCPSLLAFKENIKKITLLPDIYRTYCPSSYKMGHQTCLSLGVSGSSVWLIMQPAFDVASGDTGWSVS